MFKKPRILFFGTPLFSVPTLEALLSQGYGIAAVVTQPDKPQGRKKLLTHSPIKKVALSHAIPILQPKIFDDAISTQISALTPDIAIVVAYGHIIPESVLRLFPFGMLNIHPSPLPKLRGPSPIQSAILQNFSETAITIMLMDKGMDTGPLLYQENIPVEARDTYETLALRLGKKASTCLLHTLPLYLQKSIQPKIQDNKNATYCKLIKKDDGLISWDNDAEYIDRQIRALNPWPGTFTKFSNLFPKVKKDFLIKIKQARHGEHGVLVKQCGSHSQLTIEYLQPAGKTLMSAQIFLQGYKKFIS